jgi:hypothetical protein
VPKVIEALVDADLAILGLEFWELTEEPPITPRVLGWSEYNLELLGSWDEVVKSSATAAHNTLAEHEIPLNAWVSMTWISMDERS